MDTESVRLRDGDAGLQNRPGVLTNMEKSIKIHHNMHIRQALKRESR